MIGMQNSCAFLVCICLCFKYVFGDSKQLTQFYFTYTAGDVLESITAGSLLQCSNRCVKNNCCLAVEWQDMNSICVVLRKMKPTSDISEWHQYVDLTALGDWDILGDSYYRKISGLSAWDTCEEKCAAFCGAYMAVETSAEESTFLEQFGRIWLGGMKVNGQWTWMNGENWVKTFWYPGEPSGNGVCLRHRPPPIAGWWDAPCPDLINACMCEM